MKKTKIYKKPRRSEEMIQYKVRTGVGAKAGTESMDGKICERGRFWAIRNLFIVLMHYINLRFTLHYNGNHRNVPGSTETAATFKILAMRLW